MCASVRSIPMTVTVNQYRFVRRIRVPALALVLLFFCAPLPYHI